MAYNLVVCGGTFDHFHKGHKRFLDYTLSIGRKIIIGITSDEYVKNLKSETQNPSLIESYEIRKKNLEEFVFKKNAQDRTSILEINDLFGPTLSKDLPIDAIVISNNSEKGAEIINQKRKELNLSLLKILITPLVKAEDGKPISSKRIRNGEVNEAGRLYVKKIWLEKDLILPEDLRQEFKRPMGGLCKKEDIENKQKSSFVISVGDETSRIFNEISAKQDISVVDFKIARIERFSSFSELGFKGKETIFTADNPAGHVTADLFNVISKIFSSNIKNKIILKIAGEEDLAVLPLILFSPLGTNIYYGQPNKGLIRIVVSTEIKDIAYSLTSKLRPI
jgi:pantetheine-phosphate adenylyltransferase